MLFHTSKSEQTVHYVHVGKSFNVFVCASELQCCLEKKTFLNLIPICLLASSIAEAF